MTLGTPPLSLPDGGFRALDRGVHDDRLRGEREFRAGGRERVSERAYFLFRDQAMLPPDVDSSADVAHEGREGTQTRLLRCLPHDAG